MNTNLLLVTNVPKCFKQLDILKCLDNKWARMIFVDNAYADLYDAFIYNPTPLLTHFEMGITNLRNLVWQGNKPLKVYHLWFPPPNVFLTSKVPENSIMLPFLFVDNLPKECNTHEVIGELPFQANEIKHWDVPQKEDKWMILRLPINQDEAIRDYVLKYIRSRRLSNGLYPRVLEVFVSEEARLAINMIPRTIKCLPITTSYKSNLIFLYDLSPKLTTKDIVETCKSLGIKGTRAFFIDVVNSLKVGFLFVPRSLPEARFVAFQNTLAEKEITVDMSTIVMLNLNDVWLQPKGANQPKHIKASANERPLEYVLTYYIYIHNVPASVDHNQLSKSSPINFKVYLFQVMENTTQIGFVCLRGLSDDKISTLINHLRSLKFENCQVMVDNIYLKCYDLPENYTERRSVHIPRNGIEDNINVTVNNQGEIILVDNIDIAMNEEMDDDTQENILNSAIELAIEPPEHYKLMKSDFIYVGNLPLDADMIEYYNMGIESDNLNTMSRGIDKVAFFYYPDTDVETWIKILEKIAVRNVKGTEVEVFEIYLQSEESYEFMDETINGIHPSNYIFVYNISDSSDTRKFEENDNIVRFSIMTPESGTCAFVELNQGLTTEEIFQTLNYIRDINQRGSNLCADLVWLARVKVKNNDSTNGMRNKWIKKSGPAKRKKFIL